ncbi:MAG: hypothetical protein KDA85_19600 [Planctomycetaceae bacterium]|nr:hypothetical protein [Planctomycetaceae bacterium]
MKLAKTALLALTVALSLATVKEVHAQDAQLTPDGYLVQALCFGGYEDGNFWVTVGCFETYQEAAEYEDYLYFLANKGATVNARGQVDTKTWQKLLDEVNLPEGVYLHGFDYRIVPYYDYSRYLSTPMYSLPLW